MLQPYRRHLRSCPHRAKGQGFTLCRCPIWAYGNVKGKTFRQSLKTNDGSRVEQIMQAIEAGRPVYLQPQPLDRTVAAAVSAFLEVCRGRGLRQTTIDSYTKTLSYLDGTVALDMIDAPFLDAHRASRMIAASTWRKELETLRAFFAWCLDRKWITDNPAKRLRMPRIEDLSTLPFTAEEIDGLQAACDVIASDNHAETAYIRQRARALVLVLLYSGLRISDVAQLRRAALETSGHLVLRVLKTGVRLKVLLHPDAVTALKTLPSVSPEYFFWTGRGSLTTCIKNMRRTVQRLGIIAKVHAHPHRFRDTFAVELLTQGADIRTVQKLLGHTSVRTTEKHYAHFVAAHQALLDSAAARLDFQRGSNRQFPVHLVRDRLRNAK